MMYKIIKDNKIVDIVQYADFIRFLPTGRAIRTSRDLAEGIVGSDNQTLYSFKPVQNTKVSVATIKKITYEEFSRLQSLLNSGKEICADESVLARAKHTKLKSLSAICKNQISTGFSVTLLDGKEYHFKLTAEDQLNLLNLENLFNAGEESFIYHATNELCRVFTREDMSKILKAYRTHLLYHTTYFNAAKHYINSLSSINEVNKFTYGTDVAQECSSVTLKNILRNGATVE